MSVGELVIERAKANLNQDMYRELHWTGSFTEYLDLVQRDPKVARLAFERIYEMILAAGTREYIDSKKKVIHYAEVGKEEL